jgi:hypothetical protein
MCDVFDRLVFAIGDNLVAAFICSHAESAMHDADEPDELTAFVLDEKAFFVADLEFRRVAHAHRLAFAAPTSLFRSKRPTLERTGHGTTKIFCESGSLTLLPGAYPLTSISPPLGSNGL